MPETKRGYELLREMQREKQHMRIVIDEYGAVSGLVTIEDLLEEIVGDIRDEHEKDGHISDPQRRQTACGSCQATFRWAGSPSFWASRWKWTKSTKQQTLGGLVSEIEGRIPLPGEVVLLDHAGLRIQVVASTDRRVERLRIFPPVQEDAATLP